MNPLHRLALLLACGTLAIIEESLKLLKGQNNAVFTSSRPAMGFLRDSDNRIPAALHELRMAERRRSDNPAGTDWRRSEPSDWTLWGIKGADWRRGLDTGSKRLIVGIVVLAFFMALGQWGRP